MYVLTKDNTVFAGYGVTMGQPLWAPRANDPVQTLLFHSEDSAKHERDVLFDVYGVDNIGVEKI